MRVLLTRSAENCRKSAARLGNAGHAGVILPMLEYVPTGENFPEGNFDAVVLTSAAAVVCIDQPEAGLLAIAAYCVGETTAIAAREAGFLNVIAGPGDASELARLIAGSGAGGKLLYPAPLHKAFDFAAALSGWQVCEFALYEARLIDPGKTELETALRQSDAVFLYSPRMAAHLSEIASAHSLVELLGGLTLVAISEKTAHALRAPANGRILVASHPSEASMIGLLSRIAPGPMY